MTAKTKSARKPATNIPPHARQLKQALLADGAGFFVMVGLGVIAYLDPGTQPEGIHWYEAAALWSMLTWVVFAGLASRFTLLAAKQGALRDKNWRIFTMMLLVLNIPVFLFSLILTGMLLQ